MSCPMDCPTAEVDKGDIKMKMNTDRSGEAHTKSEEKESICPFSNPTVTSKESDSKETENKECNEPDSKMIEKKECNEPRKAPEEKADCKAPDAEIVVWQPKISPSISPRCSTGSPEGKKASALPKGDNLKAVLFDIDGTIADTDRIHFLAFQEILVEAGYNGGVPITHEFFIRQMSGKLNYVIAQELMPELDEARRVQYMDEKEVRYRSMAAKDIQPIPGFHQFVEWVKKRGLRRAAVTNSPRANAEQVLVALGVTDFFEILVVGNECEHPKPFPDPYLQAIKFLEVEPNQAFVLEDSPSGVKAGVAAGSVVVGLLTGHPGPVLLSVGASHLIKDYNDPALWTALGDPSDKPWTQACPSTVGTSYSIGRSPCLT